MLPRLWNRDVHLWSPELSTQDEALARMDWALLRESLPQFLGQMVAVPERADGLIDRVFLSSEGTNLCVRALLQLPGVPRSRKVVVLDGVLPENLRETEKRLDLPRTIFFS